MSVPYIIFYRLGYLCAKNYQIWWRFDKVLTKTSWVIFSHHVHYDFNIRGAFNKIQDYVLNTTRVNRTFLTVMLLFNIFSPQFTAMFLLFYKSAGTRSIKFFIGTCRNFADKML